MGHELPARMGADGVDLLGNGIAISHRNRVSLGGGIDAGYSGRIDSRLECHGTGCHRLCHTESAPASEDVFVVFLYPAGYPGSSNAGSGFVALDLRGLFVAPTEPEINVFVGSDNTGTPVTDGQVAIVNFGSSLVGTDLPQTFAIENAPAPQGDSIF